MRSATTLTRTRTMLGIVLSATMLLFVLSPAVARASTLGALNIVLLYDSDISDTPLLGVTGRLADNANLPAEIVLPVPESPNVMWSGEYFLEEDRENIPVDPRMEARNGVPAMAFTLTQSRLGHAEIVYPGSSVVANSLTGLEEIGFDLTLPVDSGPVYAAIAVPPTLEVLAGSDVVQMSREADGLTYYYIERESASAGDSVALSLQVKGAAAPEMHNEPVPWMTMLVGVVIVGAAFLLVFARRRKSNPA